MVMDLNNDQLKRYNRQIILKEIGREGQSKILNAKVLVVGIGGLGSPVAFYLAAAGVGTIGVADNDVVDLSNLQRQIIHFTDDLHKPKVVSAADKIRRINPDVDVKCYQEFIGVENVRKIIKEFDFIVSCSDNFEAKFLVNDACVMENIPYSHGGVIGFEGQAITVVPGKSACYRCFFGELPTGGSLPSASETGILGAAAGMLGTIQAAETIKYITGSGKLLTNQLLSFNAGTMDFFKVTLKPQPECSVCGESPKITELV